ncbi:phage portal protein [Bacillus mobilis]|uniref:phage portal protein n=1 Tax=Bacillus mobilis TaxID=2026190 RepID=UPI003D65F219
METLIKKHSVEVVPHLNVLKNYYIGKHDILNRTMADPTKPNNKMVNSYGSYIVDMTQGYFLGKPVTYTSKNDSFLEKLQVIYHDNDEQAHNSLLSKDASIHGVAYEMLYINEKNEIKFAILPVKEVFMIYDTSINPSPVAAIRYYGVTDYISNSVQTKVEVYTDKTIKYYNQGKKGLELVDEKQHYFGGVPVVPYFNNDEEQGDFEKVVPLIDAYDKAVSDQVNDMEYMADSFLVLKNVSVDADDIRDMKNNRTLVLDSVVEGAGASAEWLVKKTDNATIESYKNRLQQDIHKFSYTPDLTDTNFGSNLSGISLQYKFMGLEQICGNKERLFKMSLVERVTLIANILNIKGGNYSPSEVEMQFTRNLPFNLPEKVQLVKDLYGILPNDTLLAQLPFVLDAQAELDKLEEQNGNNTGEYNFPVAAAEPTIE